jgi:hypothetical protein
MHHKTALNKDSKNSFIKSSEESTRTQDLADDNSHSIDVAIRIIKNLLGSTGDSPLLFQIGKDDCLYQVLYLKGTCFQRFRRVL